MDRFPVSRRRNLCAALESSHVLGSTKCSNLLRGILRADFGPGVRASLVGFVGMITRSIPPCLCRSSHTQAQSRRDTESPLSLRFRDVLSCRWMPEVGQAPSAHADCVCPLSFRASAAGRDTPRSGARWRAPSLGVSRPSLFVFAAFESRCRTKPFTPAAADGSFDFGMDRMVAKICRDSDQARRIALLTPFATADGCAESAGGPVRRVLRGRELPAE